MRIRIIQISDMHLNMENDTTFDVNGSQQFISVLETAADLKPDAIVLAGDFCLDQPDPEVYPFVKSHMENLDIPHFAIAGNHDDSRGLANVFHPEEIKDGELYYTKRINSHFIVFLDSSTGRFSSAQWLWLEDQLKTSAKQLHIFMHHPPIYAGAPHMDNHHAFMEEDRFVELMSKQRRPIHVYAGHYHMARNIQFKNIHVHIAPSTLFQMNPYSQDFELWSTTPGFQVIDLNENRAVTSIHWVTK